LEKSLTSSQKKGKHRFNPLEARKGGSCLGQATPAGKRRGTNFLFGRGERMPSFQAKGKKKGEGCVRSEGGKTQKKKKGGKPFSKRQS